MSIYTVKKKYIYISIHIHTCNTRFQHLSNHPFQMIWNWKFKKNSGQNPKPLWVLMTGYFAPSKNQDPEMDPLEGAKRAMAKNLRAVPKTFFFCGFGENVGGIGGHDSNCGRKKDLKIFFFDFWGWKFQRWSISIAGHQTEWYGFI